MPFFPPRSFACVCKMYISKVRYAYSWRLVCVVWYLDWEDAVLGLVGCVMDTVKIALYPDLLRGCTDRA